MRQVQTAIAAESALTWINDVKPGEGFRIADHCVKQQTQEEVTWLKL
jgi:hypothetical protein